MNEQLKKLTGKNKKDYEAVANHLVNDCDTELFKELVENDDYLFYFVKQNVAQRLSNEVDRNNYRNLLYFMKYYSPSYENFIVNSLVKYADEDLTDEMLAKLENGNIAEKTYAAKYFSYIQDPLSIEYLRKNAHSDNQYLAVNCAISLGVMNVKESYNLAIAGLNNGDDFEKLAAVKFLTAYGNKDAVPAIIDTMKNSPMAENIAGEIPYLENLFDLLDDNSNDGLLVLNYIINGLGEILDLSIVFDFELYEVFEKVIHYSNNSKAAVVLLNAKEKFNTLTENDEYLFDEDKDTKNEINDIHKLLKTINNKELEPYINDELNENSPFVYTALDFAKDIYTIRELLKSNNQTLILKTAEVLKKLDSFDETARTVALLKVTDINIKAIIRAL